MWVLHSQDAENENKSRRDSKEGKVDVISLNYGMGNKN
jgi:hypothetical protein